MRSAVGPRATGSPPLRARPACRRGANPVVAKHRASIAPIGTRRLTAARATAGGGGSGGGDGGDGDSAGGDNAGEGDSLSLALRGGGALLSAVSAACLLLGGPIALPSASNVASFLAAGGVPAAFADEEQRADAALADLADARQGLAAGSRPYSWQMAADHRLLATSDGAI